MRIRNKLFLLVGVFGVSMGLFLYSSGLVLDRSKVGGPLYGSIVRNKDLVADILPPPLFIIEAYLAAHEIEETTDQEKLEDLATHLEALATQFEQRRAYWVEELPSGALSDSLLNRAVPKADEFFRIARAELIPAVRAGDTKAGVEIFEQRLTPLFHEHMAFINQTVELANAESVATESSVTAEVRSNIILLYELAAGLVGATFVVGLLISRSVTKPINEVVAAMQGIAEGEADLTRRLPEGRRDEAGELAKWFNTFVQRMHDTILRVSRSTEQVASASTEIASASEQSACGLRSQSEQTASMSGAVEQMSVATSDIAHRSAEAARIASEAGNAARDGAEKVVRTVEGIQAVATLIGETAETVSLLGGRSQQIGRIIEVINDIADQTNLLALNAAIEAARAGEHGRGFAVVADEVRKLADRTTKATAEVAQSISEIQTETGSAVDRIQRTSVRVSEGVALVEQTRSALQSICASTAEVSGVIEAIAAAAEEQNSSSDSVRASVGLIETASQEAASGAAENAKAATNLSSQSAALRALVSEFKLADDGGSQPKAKVNAGGRAKVS